MLKNYIKLALKMLRRRKLFTFVCLFSISITLMILTVLIVLIDYQIGGNAMESERDRTLYVERIDLFNGRGWERQGTSYYFLNHYLSTLQTPESMSVYRMTKHSAFHNNRKRKADLYYTDNNYWNIIRFKFAEGKAYSAAQVSNAEPVAVINQKMQRDFFGNQASVGKSIDINGTSFKVVGVVENLPAHSTMWAPVTTDNSDFKNVGFTGDYKAILLAKNSGDLEKMQREVSGLSPKISMPDPEKYSKIRVYADTSMERFARKMGPSKEIVMTVIVIFMVLFMLIPSVNLVNINISHIMERSSEIGIRKAFGATSKVLVKQFVVENILLTLMGGFIGFLLTIGLIQLIGHSHIISFGIESISWRVFLYSLITYLFFGLLSGVYPAYKMSKLNVVQALKGGTA
jgi:putative ABC transport system permease protein